MPEIKILQKPSFEKVTKKLKSNAKEDLYKAIKYLIKNPTAGNLKKGDLAGIRVYKFKMVKQLTLLAYIYDEETMTLLMLGTHENFYRNLKH